VAQGPVSGADGGGYGHVDSAVSWHVSLLVKPLRSEQGSLPNVDIPNNTLHIDNLNMENVHFKSLICDPSSSCFALGGSSSAVVNALRLHGILYEGLSGEARRAALVHHLFYGHCHRRTSIECRAVAQMSTTMASLATFLSEEVLVLFRCSQLSSLIFKDLCLLLGFRKEQAHSDSNMLAFYEHCLDNLHWLRGVNRVSGSAMSSQ